MRASLRSYLTLCVAALVISSPADAWVAIGHGRVIGTVGAGVDYDSNIFANNAEVGDWMGTLNGQLRYVRDSGIITFDTAVGATAMTFADHGDQDGVDPFVSGKFGYQPSEKTSLNGGLSYRRNSIGNAAVNDRTKSNDLLFNAAFEHAATEKLAWRVDGVYSGSNYLTGGV
jgi:hypothetical protein